MLDVFKTLTNGILEKVKTFKGDWNENNNSSPNYIKNRTHWTNTTKQVLVDNLTSADYNDSVNVPSCNFIVGSIYQVIWNKQVYDNLICYKDGDYNVIASEENSCPFYINDDGGYGLYIESDDEEYIISIIEVKEEIHKIDEKYIPTMSQYANKDDVYAKDETYNIDEVYNKNEVYSKNEVYTKQQVYSKNELSPVATSGDFYDLENIPCGIEENISSATVNNGYKQTSNDKTFMVFDAPISSVSCMNGESLSFELRKSPPNSVTYITTDYITPSYQQTTTDSFYGVTWTDYVYGNANLYDSSQPDSGENWYVCCNTYRKTISVYHTEELPYGIKVSYKTTEITQLDEQCIPDTIARTESVDTLSSNLSSLVGDTPVAEQITTATANYYTKAEIDTYEFITTADIDEICGGTL